MQQHTHPKVAWYSELDSPSPAFFQAQLHSTPHLVFPYFVRLFMRNIMEHTAHHADPGNIPLYSLPEAQKSLERFFGDQILYENWTPFTFLRTTRICRLYDYSTHQWIDYDGKPLTESLYERYLIETKVDELQSVAY
jgi:omega-6 fatty acid desaturase (delta-12 desaturase)